MKTKELIEILQDVDPDGDGDVHFGYDFGDRTHTTVAPEVFMVELAFVEHSSYHDMPKVTEEGDDARQVILLRG